MLGDFGPNENTSVVILSTTGELSLSTLYTANGTLLASRTVTAGGNNLTFNMGSNTFFVMGSIGNSGVIGTSGVTLTDRSTNPGSTNTLWVSGGRLFRGTNNLESLVSTDAGNILLSGTDGKVILTNAIICTAISTCSIDSLSDVNLTSPSGGFLLQFNGSNWVDADPFALGLLSGVARSSCFTGDGTSSSPLAIQLDPTGLLSCGPSGLKITGTLGMTSALVSGCVGGSGITGSPLYVRIDPTGYISCGANGLKLSAVPADNLGNHTATDTLNMSGFSIQNFATLTSQDGWLIDGQDIDDNANAMLGVIWGGAGGGRVWSVTASGTVRIYETPLLNNSNTNVLTWDSVSGDIQMRTVASIVAGAAVTTAGCFEGDGTASNPLTLKLHPSGGILCSAEGLYYFPLSGGGCSTAFSYESLTYSGVPVEPVTPAVSSNLQVEVLDNAINFFSRPSGSWIFDKTFFSTSGIPYVVTTGCFNGSGTAASPLQIKLDPTGLLACGAAGLRYTGPTGTVGGGSGIASVITSGCIVGDGTTGDAVRLNIDPTGYIQCGSSGLKINDEFTRLYIESGCFDGVGSSGDPLSLRLDPTGLLTCGSAGLRFTGDVTSDVSYFTGATNNGNSGSSITISFVSKANQKVTLTNNCTFSFTAPADERQVLLHIIQNASGGWTPTFPASVTGVIPTVGSGINEHTVLTFYYDGTVYHV